jgi:hypothetical protein
MNIEPSQSIQDAVYYALAAVNAAGHTETDRRIFLRVPADTPLPYIEFGQDHVFGAHDEGGEMFEVNVEVSAFAANMDDLKAVVTAIYSALYAPIEIVGFKAFEYHYDGTRYLKEFDETGATGTVEQAECSFRYLVERQPV